MKSFLNKPKVQLSLLLLLIFVSLFIQNPTYQSLFLLITSVGLTVLFDLTFTFIRRKKLFTPYAALASGLIISLIIDPTASFFAITIIAALAMGAKNFLRFSNRHIFNPAAFGLFFAGLLFQLPVSWWGVASQVPTVNNLSSLLLFAILISPLLVSALRMRRFATIGVFILINSVLSFILVADFSLASFVRIFLDPTTLFFTAVMLPEPMTSPVNIKRQALYGTTVAVLTVLISLFTSLFFLPDVFIPALLIGNLLFFRYR